MQTLYWSSSSPPSTYHLPSVHEDISCVWMILLAFPFPKVWAIFKKCQRKKLVVSPVILLSKGFGSPWLYKFSNGLDNSVDQELSNHFLVFGWAVIMINSLEVSWERITGDSMATFHTACSQFAIKLRRLCMYLPATLRCKLTLILTSQYHDQIAFWTEILGIHRSC